MDVALQRQGWWLLRGNCSVKLEEEFLAGLHERQWCDQTYAFGNIQGVSADVIGVVPLEFQERSRVSLVGAAGQRVHAAGGGGVDAAVMLRVVHLVERLHGCADLLTCNFLIKSENEAVGARTIFPGNYKRVELRVSAVSLCSERQPLRHAQLWRKGGSIRMQCANNFKAEKNIREPPSQRVTFSKSRNFSEPVSLSRTFATSVT